MSLTIEPWPGLWEKRVEVEFDRRAAALEKFEGVAELTLVQNTEAESLVVALSEPKLGTLLASRTVLYGVAQERVEREAAARTEAEALRQRAVDEARRAAVETAFLGRFRLLADALASVEGHWLYAARGLLATREQLIQRLKQFSNAANFELADDCGREAELIAAARKLSEEVACVSIELPGEESTPRPRIAPAKMICDSEFAFAVLEDCGVAAERLLRSVKKCEAELVTLRVDAERALHGARPSETLTQWEITRLRDDLARFREAAKDLVCKVLV
jgi:hypothetical protein